MDVWKAEPNSISERNKSFISIKILDTHDTQDYLVVWVQKHRLRQIQLDWGFIMVVCLSGYITNSVLDN
ncbi:hypothetical protein RCL_jg25699.t1 [Rhizophagus clarus]|uniref:Uncharacterized protein n=1 Tax=Rhizophagus clarus TaxID=94130 RepID=A0A8H3QTR0_9GLOM|nr:hypothetical protein RCL_jg25699.t1 [Rhizophagus clarus]